MMFKVFWVAGMPRSGSMWTFNVVRELARHAGFRVLPENLQFADQECIDYANRVIAANRDPDTIFVLKIHSFLQDIPSDNLVIANIRDIRDALVSYMRFMHVDFEKALEVAKININLADHYFGLPKDQHMVLRYDEMTSAPTAVVTRIADRLGLGIDDASAGDIAAQFSKEKVKALTECRDRRYREGRVLAGDILLARADGQHVTVDPTTGFQSDHVSDYRDGDWRRLLSEKQIGLMSSAFDAWLSRHGFAA